MHHKSLRTELLLSHLLLVGLMFLVMLVAVAGFFRLGQSIDRILKDNYKSVVAAQNMKDALERMDSASAFYLAGQAEKAQRQYQENRPLFEDAYRIEAGNVTERGEQAAADDIGRRFLLYRQDEERLLFSRSPLPQTSARRLYFERLEPQFVQIKERVQEVLALNQEAIVRADIRAKDEAARATLISIGITVVATLLGLGLAWRNIGSLMTPLVSLTRQAKEVGAGRLNQKIEVRRTDEIGLLARSFNEMAERLQEARTLAEERLHRAERMSDAALENLYDPVVVTDAQSRVVHLNRAAEGLFGSDERARGKAVGDVVREERLVSAIERAIAQEQTFAGEGEASLISFGKEGGKPPSVSEPRVYRLRASPMQAGDGAPLGAVAVLEDVTYQQEVDRLKTEFIGVASHELRTPVTSLLLGVQLLQEGAAGPLEVAQREVVDSLRQDLLRLERLMRDLLDVTRLEAGATPLRFEAVAPRKLAQTAQESVAAQAEAKGVALNVSVADDLPLVRADPSQAGRVLINLLSNALRHTASGGSVSITAARGGDGEDTVAFAVRDTGAGIPAPYLEHIFERFVQAPGATNGGAGLGLAIAQNIVRAHGGELGVESVIGKGSVFTFTLPVVDTATTNSATVAAYKR